jgi:hypothetical protein
MKEEADRKMEKGKEKIQEKTKTTFEAVKDFLKNSYRKGKDFITGKGKVDLGEGEDNFEGEDTEEVLSRIPNKHSKVKV